MSNPYLNPAYAGENQLQTINTVAVAVEAKTGISVVRCHLGNPKGPQYEGTNHKTSEYYKKRGADRASYGYADVVGPANSRKAIAYALTKINRLTEGSIDETNIVGATGGTGALNIALSIFSDATILVSEPSYPPWKNITDRLHSRYETYDLNKSHDWLLNEDVLTQKIEAINDKNPGKPIALIYHYPHNPSGKTLTQAEAQQVGKTLNALCKKFPNLHLVQEDLYLATTAPEMGIYTPLPHLDEEAKKRAIWINSPSKMGHQQDRGAVIAAFNPELCKHLRGALSFDTLGTSMPSLLATANTLVHIADGGVDALPEGQTERTAKIDPDNHRYATGRYYQERLKALHDGLQNIETVLGKEQFDAGEKPMGAYYMYPSFDCLRGAAIPAELKPAFPDTDVFRNADDLAMALSNAHLLGLRPVTVAPGTLFTKDKTAMSVRIATIEPDVQSMRDAANTFTGIVQKTLGTDLGATFHTQVALKRTYPLRAAAERPNPPLRWTRDDKGNKGWGVNI